MTKNTALRAENNKKHEVILKIRDMKPFIIPTF